MILQFIDDHSCHTHIHSQCILLLHTRFCESKELKINWITLTIQTFLNFDPKRLKIVVLLSTRSPILYFHFTQTARKSSKMNIALAEIVLVFVNYQSPLWIEIDVQTIETLFPLIKMIWVFLYVHVFDSLHQMYIVILLTFKHSIDK